MNVWGERIGPRDLRVYARFAEDLAELPKGVRLRMAVDEDRNGKFNSLVHVLISLLVKAINAGPAKTSIRDLKRWVKLETGRFDLVLLPKPLPDGTKHAIEYQSTSYASMGEAEFYDFASDLCALVRDKLAPWIEGSPQWGECMAIVNSIMREDDAA